ncbi:MAG: glycoside hydrolase family 3 C-terminal domain-containing protein [Erysipelotrichaceae bacterium]|nr:glycoside hydrolase family 3 C-terminal domain-containing protein [Erysipelotrichaceae bacterium]
MNIKETLKKMTLEEKIQLCAGINFWESKAYEQYDIPSFFMCDGPSGLRKQDLGMTDMLGINNSLKATCYPAAVTTSNTWDKELLYRLGKAVGEEARDQKVSVVLGPGVNIKRNPLCGRNFEYFSEDPVQAGVLSAEWIKGLQSTGVGCSIKHFACNSQEKNRLTSDSVIDERTLREIYLKAFEIAVKTAHPATVMSAYPKINGVHCSDNKKLLNDILREEWGFDGMVMTDWGGMSNRIEAFKAGNDLMMPGGSDYMEKEIAEAVKNGNLKEEEIDKCCERVIRLALKAAEVLKEEYKADYLKHHELVVEAAEKGAVLLKNEKNLLPLKKNKKILIAGAMAENARYQGAGSSHVNTMQLEQPLDYLKDYEYTAGCDARGDTNEELLKELESKAKEADIIVVFAGLPDRYESEGFDRDDMKMSQGHVKMIETAAHANKNTVVVLMCGSAVECDWADDVRSILYMGLAGEGVGKAVYDLLFGKANPSGKLSESWPYHYEDVISSPYFAKSTDALYLEGIYVGYRYYDKANVAVRWPYGYGLSYTSFEMKDFRVRGNKVTLKVTNTGRRAGSETVQLYIGQNDPKLHRPVRELKHFEKVFLKPGETEQVTFTLTDEDFMVWKDGFKKAKGNYRIEVGNSSRDIRFTKEIDVDGKNVSTPSWQKGSWYETCKGSPTQAEWERMLGHKYEPVKAIKGQYTMENTVEEMMEHSLIMKIMYKAVEKTIAKGFDGKIDYDNPDFKMMMNASAGSPMRSMKISGGMTGGVLDGMVEMANGHYLKGIIRMIKG